MAFSPTTSSRSGGPYAAEYDSFRSSVPQKKVIVDDDGSKEWTMYDAGPKSVNSPLIFLPSVSGGADSYFQQILSLSSQGYRVLSVEPPAYWTVQAFCEGFQKLLIHLGFARVHLFGGSLGGYLAQKFSEFNYGTSKVISLILCNTFVTTAIFERDETSNLFWAMPPVLLKRMILGGFPQTPVDKDIANSIDFMVESLDHLSQSQLSSRMTLNCAKSVVEVRRVSHLPITIIDVFDECALSPEARDALHQAYPGAKKASLKSGGNFPYLSRSAEVNTHIRIHLQPFEGSQLSARETSAAEDVANNNT